MKKVTISSKVLTVMFFLLISSLSFSNNVSITNLDYLPDDEISFDVSWDNSWRNTDIEGSTQNYDGVWVFAKFRHSCAKDSVYPSASSYSHMWLANSGHTIPANATGELGATNINGTDRHLGVFLYRKDDGTGTFTIENVVLKWDQAAQSVSGDEWDIQVFAIEMVYIPEGPFFIGDGSSLRRFGTGAQWDPFLIENEDAIPTGDNPGELWVHNNSSYLQGTIPASFPKGYDGFWTMKYEITQKQYVDFLNSLSRAHQAIAAPNTSGSLAVGNTTVTNANRGAFTTWSTQRSSYRNGIRIDGPTGNTAAEIDPSKPVTFVNDLNETNPGNSSDDGQAIPVNLLSIQNVWRYIDWIGLRPMNEFEFEKITRGPSVSPPYMQISGETIWGTSPSGNITSGGAINNAGTAEEQLTTSGTGLVVGSGNTSPAGPRRIGITHTSTTNRIEAGASFYGAADMGGNMDEIVIAVSMFTATHNDYSADDMGDGNFETGINSKWPTTSRTGQQYTFTTKGGGWDSGTTSTHYAISHRWVGTSSSNEMHRKCISTWGTGWNTCSGNHYNNINQQRYYSGRGVRNQGTVIE